MAKLRQLTYNAVLLSAALLPAVGCGEAAGPPPGAPQDATTPTIEQGTEAGPMDPAAGTTDSTPAAGSPSDEQGKGK